MFPAAFMIASRTLADGGKSFSLAQSLTPAGALPASYGCSVRISGRAAVTAKSLSANRVHSYKVPPISSLNNSMPILALASTADGAKKLIGTFAKD